MEQPSGYVILGIIGAFTVNWANCVCNGRLANCS